MQYDKEAIHVMNPSVVSMSGMPTTLCGRKVYNDMIATFDKAKTTCDDCSVEVFGETAWARRLTDVLH